jgi:L-threonylcarbamoyladenylate synthase
VVNAFRYNRRMSSAEIQKAAELLRNGGVVAFPTETVYGLGASALDPVAVAKVFEIKARPNFDPLIVHAASAALAFTLAAEVPPMARRLAEKFWPGPLTMVLPRKPIIPDIVTSGLPTVGLRVPSHPMALELIKQAGVPVAAPSANKFGRISPTTAAHVREELGDAPDMILDGGPCNTGVESTVISIDRENRVTLLRPGGVPPEALEQIAGPIARATDDEIHPASPGQLPQHYAPRTPLAIAGFPVFDTRKRIGYLAFSKKPTTGNYTAVEVLSPTADLREAAANLFACLRKLDAKKLDQIVVEPAPNEGLGVAINDRLRRAVHR